MNWEMATNIVGNDMSCSADDGRDITNEDPRDSGCIHEKRRPGV